MVAKSPSPKCSKEIFGGRAPYLLFLFFFSILIFCLLFSKKKIMWKAEDSFRQFMLQPKPACAFCIIALISVSCLLICWQTRSFLISKILNWRQCQSKGSNQSKKTGRNNTRIPFRQVKTNIFLAKKANCLGNRKRTNQLNFYDRVFLFLCKS